MHLKHANGNKVSYAESEILTLMVLRSSIFRDKMPWSLHSQLFVYCLLHPGSALGLLFSVDGEGGLPLWSSSQSFWLQSQRSWVRFPVLPDFFSSSGSWTGSTQSHEHKSGATWKRRYRLQSRKLILTAVGVPPHWPRDTPQSTNLALIFANRWQWLGHYSLLAD
jgi:hypothetical protein